MALVVVLSLGAAGCGGPGEEVAPASDGRAATGGSTTGTSDQTSEGTAAPEPAVVDESDTLLPNGTRRVFARDDFLVAYYGTASTGSLGVLGEGTPEQADQRLRAAARPFRRPGVPVQRVYELIATVADAGPGDDGDYSHDIARSDVRRWIDLAHEHDALLILDLQTGRSGFLSAAKRWAWALRDPWVGLALDPEWRLGANGVPGRRLGSVSAREVNRTSAWLADLVERRSLPQKPFVLHQFRTSMIPDIGAIRKRKGLAMVQHVDGFGTPGEKLATYGAVARPKQFTMGFKLFYDEDVRRMSPAAVHRIRPEVRFVSFQ